MNQIRVEYIKDGINKAEYFDTFEDAENWADGNGLEYDQYVDEEKQYRFTS